MDVTRASWARRSCLGHLFGVVRSPGRCLEITDGGVGQGRVVHFTYYTRGAFGKMRAVYHSIFLDSVPAAPYDTRPMPEATLRNEQAKEADSPPRIGVLLFVSVSFGLAFGIYEPFLPLYWSSVVKMEPSTMGYIFALAALGVFVLRIYVGRLSDIFGRKLFYTLALGGSCAAQLATPLLPHTFIQGILKSSREASGLVRDTMHSVLLYEQSAKRFMGSIGITRGAEFTCHGLGSFAGGLLLVACASAGSQPNFEALFIVSGGLILLATVAFAGFFKVSRTATQPEGRKVQSLKELFSTDLPSKLWLLAAFGFVFEAGLFTTHCFIMPLYFRDMLAGALDLTKIQVLFGVALIMAVHRLFAGVPMMLVGPRLKKNLKGLFIFFVFCEGITIAATPLIPNIWIAIGVWLLHDLFGASIWMPIHNNYIQKHARDESRGADVSKVQALSQLGRVAGPLLAGLLLTDAVGGPQGAPFLIGGIIVALSSLILFKL